jgi:dephospho-CoA kinase
VLLVGLTGGIGSGKSTASHLLAARGALVVDADRLAHDAVAPGSDGFDAVVERFGDAMVRSDGTLDRSALATVVFADDVARADLEAIVHPRVRREITASIARAGGDDIVVVDSPLLMETGADERFPVVVVVTASPETRMRRLIERGMTGTDARSRMDAQAPLEEKVARADVVLDNDGTLLELEAQVERLWADLRRRAAET